MLPLRPFGHTGFVKFVEEIFQSYAAVCRRLEPARRGSFSTHRQSSPNPPFAWLNTLYERTSIPKWDREPTLAYRLN